MALIWVLLKNKFLSTVSFIKKYSIIIAVFIIMVLTAIVFYKSDKIKRQNEEIARVTNNFKYYEDLANNNKESNRILQLTINEFKNTQDSLILLTKKILKLLSIKDKELDLIQYQYLKVEIDTTIVVQSNNFTQVIKPNALTSIVISKKDSILTAKIDILNELTLFIYSTKKYKYPHFITRLFKLNFKKEVTHKYQINNSNDLIITKETRIIEINK